MMTHRASWALRSRSYKNEKQKWMKQTPSVDAEQRSVEFTPRWNVHPPIFFFPFCFLKGAKMGQLLFFSSSFFLFFLSTSSSKVWCLIEVSAARSTLGKAVGTLKNGWTVSSSALVRSPPTPPPSLSPLAASLLLSAGLQSFLTVFSDVFQGAGLLSPMRRSDARDDRGQNIPACLSHFPKWKHQESFFPVCMYRLLKRKTLIWKIWRFERWTGKHFIIDEYEMYL